MARLLCMLFSLITGMLFYMFKLAHKTEVRYYTIPFFDNGKTLQIGFITDLHKRTVSQEDLSHFKEAAFICLGGDAAERSTKQEVLDKNLQQLTNTAPLYFVWGNNDYDKIDELQQLLAKHKVTELNNSAAYFQEDHWTLAGVQDKTLGFDHLDKALFDSKGPTLLLSHNPEIVWDLPLESDVRLVLSGHTHGGQIRIGRLGIDEEGGLKRKNNRTILISNGYGTTGVPLRLGARPQLHVITLVQKTDAAN